MANFKERSMASFKGPKDQGFNHRQEVNRKEIHLLQKISFTNSNVLCVCIVICTYYHILTPGISTGYWKARKIPSLALSSGPRSLKLLPLNLI